MSRRGRALLITQAAALGWSSFALGDTWDAGGGAPSWSTNLNWADNTEPTSSDPVILPAGFPGGFTSIALSAGEQANSITFNDSYSLGSNNISLFGAGGPISVASGKTGTITSSVNG